MPRGSSGSALVDGDGRLIGINTNRVGDGFYLAIPTDEALRGRIDALARGESGERPQLGIAVAPAHVARRLRRAVGLPDRDGILIREVGDGTPAERAGIESGDLLVAAGGRPVASVDDLFDALGAVGAGGSLDVTLVRGTEERTASVSFTPSSGERSDSSGGAGATAAGTDPGSPVH
jgi:serine protease Do